MLRLPDFHSGDELKASDLQAIVDWLRTHELSVLPGGGLVAVQHAGGQSWAVQDTDSGDWYKIETHVSGGHYTVRRQADDPNGDWQDATTTNEDAWESNGVSTLPNGLVVWCTKAIGGGGSRLKFTKGIC